MGAAWWIERDGLRLSRLGFGLSRLHRVPVHRDRQALLRIALDADIRYFDAARPYGDGMGERELGIAVRGARADVVVSTKFGIRASPLVESLALLRYPAMVYRRLMRTRTAARHTADEMVRSVRLSLRALSTDYVDVLFAHEPVADRFGDTEEFRRAMDRLRSEGQVRSFGLSGGAEDCIAIRRRAPGLWPILQIEDSIVDGRASPRPEGHVPHVAFGYLRDALQTSPAPTDLASLMTDLLQRNPTTCVLLSTNNTAHLTALVTSARAAVDRQG